MANMGIISSSILDKIEAYIDGTIDTLLMKYDRKIVTDVLLKEALMSPKDGNYKPFHEALIPGELFRFQAFFRSFSTTLGQGIFEFISREIPKGNEKWVVVKKGIFPVTSSKNINEIISDHIDYLEKSKLSDDKDYTIPEFPNPNSKDLIDQTVDLYLKDIDNNEYFIEIKSPKPNKGQIKDTKRDLLLLKASYPNSNIRLSFTFNPWGEDRDKYNWSYPKYFFNLKDPKSVLIGSEFWDFLGGAGTYSELLDLFGKIGEKRKDEIRSKLLSN
ncbi:MAG: TdeIII family type II restriction endonuclease [Candidatus Heimdallarchaeota archaeon]|nr:TdeIII family type II restriction endonuclease [Candidatus Heimdallarchaeota archaeon]